MSNEQKIWKFLKDKGLNDYAIAGLMGNLYAESALNPKNLQQTYEKKLGFTDLTYTNAVDTGSYTNFVKDSAGYGLAQWTYWSRKQNLLNYAKNAGKSIGDLDMQLGFLWQELQSYKNVINTLKNATSIRQASDVVLLQYERPANTSESVQIKRASYGQTYYDKYATKQTTTDKGSDNMNEQEIRDKVVEIAKGFLGCKESDGTHKQIIDIYNGCKPLPRSYAVKYTDAWCATYVTAIAIKAGLTDIMARECSCEKMIELYKKLGRWQENDAYTPKPADIIFYDWEDNGNGDNVGHSDHVGIVVSVIGSTIKIIEGNYSNAVKYRELQVNAKYIRGYAIPNYASKSTTTTQNTPKPEVKPVAPTPAPATPSKKSNEEIAKLVIKGRYGNGSDRKKRLEAEGYNYSEIQALVNKILKGESTTNTQNTPKTEYRTYTVKKGDSLWKIAKNHLGNGNRWTEIQKLNGIKGTTIYSGQVLKIPN